MLRNAGVKHFTKGQKKKAKRKGQEQMQEERPKEKTNNHPNESTNLPLIIAARLSGLSYGQWWSSPGHTCRWSGELIAANEPPLVSGL